MIDQVYLRIMKTYEENCYEVNRTIYEGNVKRYGEGVFNADNFIESELNNFIFNLVTHYKDALSQGETIEYDGDLN